MTEHPTIKCGDCDGTGEYDGDMCSKCDGTGEEIEGCEACGYAFVVEKDGTYSCGCSNAG
ncbi:MAG TPA: hypothetical protein VFN67_37410 [Polyangiales bacterium]|nr:hypothetical protein [Polyangiales bacterium]